MDFQYLSAFIYVLVTICEISADLFSKATKSKADEKDVRNSVFDFVIVGGGTAGCVLANRLSANPEWKILVLEAGDEENIDYDIPAVPTKEYRPILWNFRTERNGFSCLSRPGGSCEVKTGKVLGGSSVTNDMKYTRGTKKDYDSWHSSGDVHSLEWKFENLVEHFKASEDNGDYDVLMNSFYHARGGEMHVQKFKHVDRHMELFLGAFAEMGFRSIDINTNVPEAALNNQFVIFNNTRLSTNSAFLKPVRYRKNLVVKTGATVIKIIIDKQENTVDGVLYEIEKGKPQPAFAKKEVILTTGAVNNVRLLHLSGIGPQVELAKHNISVNLDLPVGSNYQDQVTIGGLAFSLSDIAAVSEQQLIEDFKTWFQSRGGPLASKGINQVSAFIQLFENKNGPDIELALEGNYIRSDKFMLTNVSVHLAEEANLPLAYYNLVNINPVLLKPKSKGKVTLNKRNPKYGRPVIQANLLKEPEDLDAVIDSIDIALQLLDTKELKKAEIKMAPLDIFPCDRLQNRDQWNCIARHYTKAMNNPIGTCRMGQNKTDSVVNHELKVHGIESLRVVDASIMPSHVRGNIFAPTVMIAEKGTRLILKDWKETKRNFL